jgi:hypothetical protein
MPCNPVFRKHYDEIFRKKGARTVRLKKRVNLTGRLGQGDLHAAQTS